MTDVKGRSFVDNFFLDTDKKVHFGKVASVAVGVALAGTVLMYLFSKDADPDMPGRQTNSR